MTHFVARAGGQPDYPPCFATIQSSIYFSGIVIALYGIHSSRKLIAKARAQAPSLGGSVVAVAMAFANLRYPKRTSADTATLIAQIKLPM